MSILVEKLCKAYDGKMVLDNLSTEFAEHQITCIMGRSGIGKTTLLRIMMGLEKADAGRITGLKGKKISAIFQENRLLEKLDAVTNIRIVTEKSEQEMIDLLEKLEIADTEKKPTASYSGGMKRRVAIARALLSEYDILLMDESLQGLDAATKQKVIEVILQYTKDKTVILVTHDEAECKAFGAKLVELKSVSLNLTENEI